MGGLIHHVVAGVISAIIVLIIFRRKDYAVAIFAGNILPDVVGAAYASVLVGSIDPAVVLKSEPWFSFQKDEFTQFFWIFVQASLVLAYLFYHVHIKKMKPHHEMEGNIAMLLLGFMTHMGMDILIQEEGVLY